MTPSVLPADTSTYFWWPAESRGDALPRPPLGLDPQRVHAAVHSRWQGPAHPRAEQPCEQASDDSSSVTSVPPSWSSRRKTSTALVPKVEPVHAICWGVHLLEPRLDRSWAGLPLERRPRSDGSPQQERTDVAFPRRPGLEVGERVPHGSAHRPRSCIWVLAVTGAVRSMSIGLCLASYSPILRYVPATKCGADLRPLCAYQASRSLRAVIRPRRGGKGRTEATMSPASQELCVSEHIRRDTVSAETDPQDRTEE